MPGGRPKNSSFNELNFELIKSGEKKYQAKCDFCAKILHNTAASRLKQHRNVCKDKIHRPENITEGEENDTILLVLDDSEKLDSIEQESTTTILSSSEQMIGSFSNNGMTVSAFSNKTMPNSETNAFVPSAGCSSTSSSSLVNFLTSTTISPSSSISTLSSPTSSCKSRRNKSSATVANYIDHLSAKEIEDINDKLANFIFGCNLPLRVVESTFFKSFIQKLRPAYVSQIPNRKTLSTKLLDNAYEKLQTQAKRAIKTDSVLLIDGWKNSSNNMKTVVSMIHNSDGEQTFIDAWDLTGISETAEKLSEIVVESVEKSKFLYGTNVYAVVSDNASAMVKMGNISSHIIWHTTCNSHTANLLAKDVLNKTLTEKVIRVVKEYKQPDLERALTDKGGQRLKLPCDTRWCSYRDTYSALLKNIDHMKAIAADKTYKKVKQSVVQLVFDDEFISEVKESLGMFDPICKIINECQKAETSIADAVNLWLDLKLPSKFQDKFQSNIESRKKMAFNKYALTAFYLHPFYDEKKLNSSEKAVVYDFLFTHLDGNGIEEWDHFRNQRGVFTILYEKNIKSPLTFWSTASIKCQKLSTLAIKLLQIPASTAQIERLFSSWNFVHNKIRNRLGFDKSKKLLHVYFSLRMKNSETLDFSDLDSDLEM